MFTHPPNIDWPQKLRDRRAALQMSIEQLAVRSGVSTATTKRILAGNDHVSLAHVRQVADALGLSFTLRRSATARELRREHAAALASQLVQLTQANAALEGQGISVTEVARLQKQLVERLLRSRRLWAS